MDKLLYLQASPLIERSYSISAADAFVKAYQKINPSHIIQTMNLFDMELPAFDGFTLAARYAIMHGTDPSETEKSAWRAVEKVIEEFTGADKYVMAVPMWNFGIPYKLKHYLDVVVQSGYTFAYSPEEGFSGLVTGKPIFIAYARGGAYPPGSESESYDMQVPYLEHVLGFMGFTDIRRIIVEPTVSDIESLTLLQEKAALRAEEMAGFF